MPALRVVDADPVVREVESRAGGNLGHVAANATSRACGAGVSKGMGDFGMTRGAARIVECRRFFERLVRIVTGKAGKSSAAFSKAGAFIQVDGLVADVPGIIPIDVLTDRRWRPMASSAEFD